MKAVAQPLPDTNTYLDGLKSFIKDDLVQVDRVIMDRMGSKAAIIPLMVSHLVSSGGKRLRPSLTLVCASMCGYSGKRHINLAAAVEFIHTATLLHDDVVDESVLRRGAETANQRWGNKASILVGDFLLGQAFRLMVDDGSLAALKILSDASAVIAEGEVMQLAASNDLSTTELTYSDIITAKTATLFAAACEIGAVIANRPETEQAALRNFGLNLGIAFQIADDALDYSAKQEELGKTIGDDFREGKITLPVIHAYNQGNAEERTFWEAVIQEKQQSENDLAKGLRYINAHQSLSYAMQRAALYVAKAREALAVFSSGKEKEILLNLLDFSVNRPY